MAHDQFIGYALNAVDAKGRVSVPAPFRDTIHARTAEKWLILGPHEREPCLVGYDIARPARLQAIMDRRFGDDFGSERDDFARAAFGAAERLPVDDNGRIILTPTLKELGQIDKLAAFIAGGDYFEIWDPRVYLDTKGESSPLGRIVRRQLDARGPETKA